MNSTSRENTKISQFVHLRVHSQYSLLEGAILLKDLPDLCRSNNMPAVAITDSNNMFGALEFSVLTAESGIQPIIGCQIDVSVPNEPTDRRKADTAAALVLLAQSQKGYENLMQLNSCLYLNQVAQCPQVSINDLLSHSEGLICLSGGPNGPVGKLLQLSQQQAAETLVDQLAAAFPDRLYIEIQRHPQEDMMLPEVERLTEPSLIDLAYQKGLPIVATNDAYFPDAAIYQAHDALICIAEGAYIDQQQPRRQLTPRHYFTSATEMAEIFSDLPEAIENTLEIAQRCAFKVATRDLILPQFAENEVEELRRQAREGLQARLQVIELTAAPESYEERLEFELKVIEDMGFPGYFLIVADFIKWAKENDIPVGPGRGSGAGSLVAYALTITDLDPLRYSLLFERFLNPERVSMPDFDIDFCMDRREEVISYVQQKYGRDRVGQIITFGAILSKTAVRDIGRVLQMPYGQVDRISKMIPMDGVKPVSVAEALREEPRLVALQSSEDVVRRLLDYSQQIEGLLRNAATHAAGVVIGDRPLDQLVPLYRDARSEMPATQFNMKWVEQAGLIKFDFLGLKTLTVIQEAVNLIKASGRHLHIVADGTELYQPPESMIDDIGAIPLDDPKTYELYANARTIAVFQVESAGMMDALKQMKPDCIEDIIALVALYRPGPIDNIPKFCEVKNGQSERETLHPLIDPILDETQGIIVYQEQVMQIAQDMAGYSLGGADLLRRAMGKKIQAAMDIERPKFMAGALENGVAKQTAETVWSLLDKFANYGFNKSHAAAYAVLSYQTAWLKANHPVEYMASMMNSEIGASDKLAIYFEEVRKRMNLPWVPPCINRSGAMFEARDGQFVYGLAGLKNASTESMRSLVKARGEQPFTTLFDFARRVDLKRQKKRGLENLAQAGAFDQLDANRRRVFESLDDLIAYSEAVFEQRASNQISLFGDSGVDLPEPRLSTAADQSAPERLAEEFASVGFYLSGHPLDETIAPLRHVRGMWSQIPFMTWDEVQNSSQDKSIIILMAGVIAGVQERKSAKGNRYAFCQLSDPTGAYEVTIFSDLMASAGELLVAGERIILQVEATIDGEQPRLIARSIRALETVLEDLGSSGLKVYVREHETIDQIAKILDSMGQRQDKSRTGLISLCLMADDLPGEIEVDLGDKFPVNSTIKGAIKSLQGVMAVEDF
ncbi:MAG: DNA polymerase III subunit alpha [Aestuariivita sp.]|nr:DNA polymerase III subunit alpha [Aestuariivita sp.]MCY4346562.1 DNA polymerase III subunit alpha [Aestuariivita sp.]